MTDQLDREIRRVMGDAGSTALEPRTWSDVAARSAALVDRGPERPTRPAAIMIAVASVAMIVVAGLVLAVRAGSDSNDGVTTEPPSPPTTVDSADTADDTTLRPLADLRVGDVAIATTGLDAYEPGPLVVHPGGRISEFELRSNDGSAAIRVGTFPGSGPRSDDAEAIVLAGVEWIVGDDETGLTATAEIGDQTVGVVGQGVDRVEFERIVDGLRAGVASDHAGTVYDVDAGTDEATRAADDTARLEATTIGAWRCWTLRTGSQDASGGCSAEAPDAYGVTIFDVNGVGRASNAVDADAPIVETIVRVVGAVPTDVDAVVATFVDGQSIVVPAEDRSGAETVHYFVAVGTVEGDAFTGGDPVTVVPAEGDVPPDTAAEATDADGPGAVDVGSADAIAVTERGIVLRHPDDGWSTTPIDDVTTGSALLIGDVVVHQAEGPSRSVPDPGPPIRIISDAGVREVTDGDKTLDLLDVGWIDGRPTILAMSIVGLPVGPDDTDDRLLLIDVETLDVTDLGVQAGWEDTVTQGRLGDDSITLVRLQSGSPRIDVLDLDGAPRAVVDDVVGEGTALASGELAVWVFVVGEDFDPVLEIIPISDTGRGASRELELNDTGGAAIADVLCTTADLDGAQLICDQRRGPPVEIDLDTGAVAPVRGLDDGVVTVRRPTP